MQIVLFFSSYFFKKSLFHSRKLPFRKICYSWVRNIDGIDADGIGNLEDSHRFVSIDEERENLIVVNDGRERTRNINQKDKSHVTH